MIQKHQYHHHQIPCVSSHADTPSLPTMRSTTTLFVALLAVLLLLSTTTTALHFSLRHGEETCLAKEVLEGDYAKGDFSVQPAQEQISVNIRDPSGELVYVRPGSSDGSFAYTAPKTGSYKVCFQNNLTAGLKTIKFHFSTSDETKTIDTARKSSLKPIEGQLKNVQGLVDTLKRDEAWIQNKQEDMKADSDSIQTLVITLNVILIVVVVGGYFGQLWYLKNYFRSKKLLMS